MNDFSMQKDSSVAEIDQLTKGIYFGQVCFTKNNEEYLRGRISSVFYSEISKILSVDINLIRSYVDDYFDYYVPSIPSDIINQPGSTSTTGLIPIYLAARTINPNLIIESGVYIGASLHLFSSIFSNIPIYAFDINLQGIKYRHSNVIYKEMDWYQYDSLPLTPSSLSMCFFDDHINCAKRIIECKHRGINFAIFDDSPDIGRLKNYRYPAVPSVPMIMDVSIPNGCTFEWIHSSTASKLCYVHQAETCEYAREMIKNAISLDCFMPVIGASVGDKWLVQINI